MRIREMRELSREELQTKIGDTRKELLDLRFQFAARKLESTAKLSTTRKRLARLLTIQTENQNKEHAEVGASASPQAEKTPAKKRNKG
jgi:large subunit ribosomal protein L29